MDEKNTLNVVHAEEHRNLKETTRLDRISTVEIDNYHGINAKIVLVYISICFIGAAQLMNIVGAGAFARDIATDVGGLSQSVWLPQSIAIVTVFLGPPVSQAADLWGRKWFLVGLTTSGVVGSLIASRATSMGMAIAGQAICGVAFGAQPLLYAVVSEILPRRFRPAAQGGLNAILALGAVIALLGGSAMVENYHEGWRIFFYMLAAMLAFSAITCGLLYNPPKRPLQKLLTNSEKLRRLDWVAYILLAFGIVLFVMALSWAANPYPWTSAQVLAPLFVGLAFLAALTVHQLRFKKDGLFHHDLFRSSRNFALVMLIMFVDGMVFFAASNYFPFEVGVLYETDAVRVGLRFSVVFFGAVASSVVVAAYSSRTKDVQLPIVASFVLFVVFFACLTSATLASSTAFWIYPIILGVGLGMSLTCLITIAQLSTPPALIAVTSGLVISIRSLGASVGLAIYTSVFNTAIADHLGHDIAAAVLPLGLPPSSLVAFITALATNNRSALMTVPGVSPQIIGAGVDALLGAYLKSFKGVWIAAAVLSAVAVIAACLLKKPQMITMHVDAPLDQEEEEI